MASKQEILKTFNSMDSVNNEVEFRMKGIGLEFLNQLYSSMDPIEVSYYIEMAWYVNDIKYRIRKILTEIDMVKTPHNIIKPSYFSTTVIMKQVIKSADYDHFSLVEASESKLKHKSPAIFNQGAKMFKVVSNIIFNLQGVIADIKYTTRIQNNRIRDEINNPNNIPFLSTEFEVKNVKGAEVVFDILYPRYMDVRSLEDLLLPAIEPTVKLSTITVSLQRLLEFSAFDNLFLTQKIDGRIVKYKVTQTKGNKSSVTLQYNVGNSSVRLFSASKSKYNDITGYGEYIVIENDRLVYPITAEIDGKMIDRIKMADIEFPEGEITFKHKPIVSGLVKPEEFFGSLVSLIKTASYHGNSIVPIDGCILGMSGIHANTITDYKIKLVNTIDVYLVFNYNNKVTIISNKGKELYLNGASYSTMNGHPNLLGIKQWRVDLASFNMFGQYIIFKDKDKKYIGFNKSVFEVDVSDTDMLSDGPSIIRVRTDKTYNTWAYKRNFGNKHEVAIDKTGITLDILVALSNDYNTTKLDLAPLVKAASIDDPGTLNRGTAYYIKASNEHIGTEQRILTNYIVSRILYTALTKFRLARRMVVVDVDGGRGSIISKAYFSEVKYLVLTEYNALILEEAKKRLADMKHKYMNFYPYSTVHATIRSSTYSSKVLAELANRKITHADAVYIGFAIHFSVDLHSLDSKSIFMNNINKITAPQSKVIITCMDGTLIRSRLDLLSEIRYKLDATHEFIIKPGEHPNTISVLNQMSNDEYMDEYIMDKESLITMFKDHKYTLFESHDFSTMLELNRGFFDNDLFDIEYKDNTRKFLKTVKTAYASPYYNASLMQLSRFYVFIRDN